MKDLAAAGQQAGKAGAKGSSPSPLGGGPALDGLVVVANERDRRTLAWLIATVGEPAILEACSALAGGRRPYVSNLCKVLQVIPPQDVLREARAVTASQQLRNIRAVLGCG
jgi:hypothetical protein